jgi:hypothetical protein
MMSWDEDGPRLSLALLAAGTRTRAGIAHNDGVPSPSARSTVLRDAHLSSRSAMREGRVPGRFIVLEGPDGVGKTTLARLLAECSYDHAVAALPSPDQTGERAQTSVRQLVFVPRRQISETSAHARELMEHLAVMLWHSGDPPDLPDSFWVGLQVSWFTAHGTAVLEPLLAAGHDVIVDGWFYKFCSKLLIQGYTQDSLEVIFARVVVPDAVVLLTADLGELFDRRQEFRPAEMGMHAGYRVLNRATFIDYQQAGLDRLRAYAKRLGWPVVWLDAASPETSAAELSDLISRFRSD